MAESIGRRPDISELIKQTKERQELFVAGRREKGLEMSLTEIMLCVAYGSYRLGLEVGAGLRDPMDVGKIKIEELF